MNKNMKRLVVALLLGWVQLSAWTAHAEEPPSDLDVSTYDGPWSWGVPLRERKLALHLFEKGNKALQDSLVEAIAYYKEALLHWEHPAIHYNLAVAQENSKNIDEQYQHLLAAIRYDVSPLDEVNYTRALHLKKTLENHATWLELSCDEPDATVVLDGKTQFTAPGHFAALLEPGEHTLDVHKLGKVFVDESRTLKLVAGERVSRRLKMYTPAEVTRTETRWSTWMPWTLMGSGLALAAGGGLLQWQTHKAYTALDAGIVECKGCMPSPKLLALRHRGDTLQRASVGAYALGGAGLVTGAVLLLLNRPNTYFINPATGARDMSISPLVGSTTGLQATVPY